VGIPGNEMADEAAKAGNQSNRFTQMEISNSRTELKTFIRDARNLKWARLWADREGIDCRQTTLFLPTLNPKVWKDFNNLIDDFTKSDFKSFWDDFEIFKIPLKHGDLI
jgi:hypothetical protein